MMNRSIFKHIFPVIYLYILIAGCAKIGSPSGGPKDKVQPLIVKSIPPNSSKNFRGKKIVITFNEFVVLDKINEKFMVSPPMKIKPVVSMKNKNVIIEYEDDLRDSTTYTFNFQDAIRDLNENNPIENYQFVFSTGPVIDSLSVTGNVYQANDLNSPAEVLVSLYIEQDDSAFVKSIPGYLSRVDKNGYFRIDNVRGGKYRLYALKDADNSKNYNLNDEELAFLDSAIMVTPENNYLPLPVDTVKVVKTNLKTQDTVVKKGEHRLFLFQPGKKLHYFTSSSRSVPYKLVYTLSLPPDTLGFDFSIPGTAANSFFVERSRDNDTIQVWLTDSALYSQQIITSLITYPFTDTTGNTTRRQDTVMMRFLTPRSTRAKPKPVPFKVSSNITSGTLRPGSLVVFNSQTPFRKPDTSRIRLYEVDATNRKKLPFNLEQDSANSCLMRMRASFARGSNYLFIADSASFGNIYGEQSDSTGNKFTVKSDESFGKLVLNVRNYEGSRIIQLLTETEKPVREILMEKDGKVEFPLLDKGSYRVRVVYDLNGDGKWTTGDFFTRRQPEPVSYLPLEVDIKENWVRDYDWDISEMNSKKLKSPAAGSSSTRSQGRM
jgi:hypothetical protein